MADGSAPWRGIAETCRRLSGPAERERSRRFTLEGYRLHERAVRAEARLETVLVAETALAAPTERMADLKAALVEAGAQVVSAPDEVVAGLTAGRGNGPLVGISVMPPRPELVSDHGSGAFLVAADVEDPGNVGAMLRTALAAGCSGFIAAGISDPYHPKAVRTSMGALFRMPVHRYDDPLESVTALKAAGIDCVGAVSRSGVRLQEAGLGGGGVALFLGGEAHGLQEPVLGALDRAVTIPMSSKADSYSVNAAAAILLYELFRGQ